MNLPSSEPTNPSSRNPTSARLCRLDVRDLRNIASVHLEFSPTINVLCGANGQGKTSLLEAIYLVATSRSFRTHKLSELIRHGTKGGSSRGWFSDVLGEREQFVGLAPSARQVRVDGNKPESMAQYAVRTPVVVFHPGELALTMGSATGRRTLLDRAALFFDPRSHAEHAAYQQAMKERMKHLQVDTPDVRVLDVYEQLAARHGAALTRHRQDAAMRLTRATQEAFGRVAPDSLHLGMRYESAGSSDEDEARKQLCERRSQDARRRAASFGPHRDDLLLELNGSPVRTTASQGQHRLLTLSLKIAEMVCVGEAAGLCPILLLDDVSSELDAERTDAFFRLLGHRKDQVFLTTTRPDMVGVFERAMGEAKVFSVEAGSFVNV